jgi:hypothetical protein
MIRVDTQTYGAIWAFVAIVIGAGWAAFGILGNDNQVFLAVMVVITMILGGGTAVLLRRRSLS